MIERREMMMLTGSVLAAAAFPASAERRRAALDETSPVPGLDNISGASTAQSTGGFSRDRGSNMLWVGRASELTTIATPAGTDMIFTSGFSRKGVGHARYKLFDPVTDAAAYAALSAVNTAQAAGQGIWWFQMADRKRAMLAEPEPCAEMMGAIGDAVYSPSTGLWSGTDNTLALQAWLDYCIYVAKCPARIGSGAFLHSATLHAGYGNQFVSAHIVGAGLRYAGNAAFAGTALVNNFSDRPALNFAGQRSGSIVGISFVGSFFKHISEGNACSHRSAPSFDDTVMRNWLPSTADPRALNRYSTYAAITIDGFNDNQGAIKGTDPETGIAYTTYVTPAWPAWTGLSAGRGTKGLSSGVVIEASFRGFGAGWIVHPGNTDGNGDFIEIRSASVDYCVYAGSYCNSQGRNQRIGYLSGALSYCAITTNRHGRRNGRLGGTLESISFSGLIRLMEIHTASIVTSTIFQQTYVEGGLQIGTCNGLSSSEVEITLASATIDLGLQDTAGRGVPPFVWGHPSSAGGCSTALRLSSGQISNFPYVADFRTINLRLDGVAISPSRFSSANVENIPPFMAHVANATLGVTVPGLMGKRAEHRVFAALRHLGTGANMAQIMLDSQSQDVGTRDIGTPIWVRGLRPSSTAPYECVSVLPYAGTLNPTGLTITSDATRLSGDVDPIRLRLEGNIGAGKDAFFAYQGGSAGSVIRHAASGTVFAIYSYDSATGAFKARALNNYRFVRGKYEFFDGTVLGDADVFACYYSGYSTPVLPSFATYLGGSSSVTAFERGNGSSLESIEVADGDRIFVNPHLETHINYMQNLISSLDLVGKTFTLPQGAAADANRQRVYGLLRAPPPNL